MRSRNSFDDSIRNRFDNWEPDAGVSPEWNGIQNHLATSQSTSLILGLKVAGYAVAIGATIYSTSQFFAQEESIDFVEKNKIELPTAERQETDQSELADYIAEEAKPSSNIENPKTENEKTSYIAKGATLLQNGNERFEGRNSNTHIAASYQQSVQNTPKPNDRSLEYVESRKLESMIIAETEIPHSGSVQKNPQEKIPSEKKPLTFGFIFEPYALYNSVEPNIGDNVRILSLDDSEKLYTDRLGMSFTFYMQKELGKRFAIGAGINLNQYNTEVNYTYLADSMISIGDLVNENFDPTTLATSQNLKSTVLYLGPYLSIGYLIISKQKLSQSINLHSTYLIPLKSSVWINDIPSNDVSVDNNVRLSLSYDFEYRLMKGLSVQIGPVFGVMINDLKSDSFRLKSRSFGCNFGIKKAF